MNKRAMCGLVLITAILSFGSSSCKVYSFKDVSIPPEVHSIHISYIENRAPLVNPLLAPQLNDALRQKINNQASRLNQVTSSDADWEVNGWVSGYNYTTSGISNQVASSNRLLTTVACRLNAICLSHLAQFPFETGMFVGAANNHLQLNQRRRFTETIAG